MSESEAERRVLEFLDAYRELEEAISAKARLGPGESPVRWLCEQPKVQGRELARQLDLCREVRNVLTHRARVAGSFALWPSEEMLALLRRVSEEILHPQLALSVAVPAKKLLHAELDDAVKPVVEQMSARDFSVVPIVQERRVAGLFSEAWALDLLLLLGGSLDEDLRFGDLLGLLEKDFKAGELFEFCARNETLDAAGDRFERALKAGKQLKMLFVTEHGKQSEAVLAALTAWDIAAQV